MADDSQPAAPADTLAKWAAQQPDVVAVVDERQQLSYDEFNRWVNRVAAAIASFGVQPGDTVVWVGPNSAHVVAVVNALRKARMVAVPMNYHLTPEEAAYIIDNSDAVAVLFDVAQVPQLESVQADRSNVRVWAGFGGDDVPAWARSLDEAAAAAPDDEPGTEADTEEGAPLGGMMIYTSGTTGKPKGAIRGTGGSSGTGLLTALDLGFNEVYVTTGPLYHSAPLGFMTICQTLGGTVIVQKQFDPEGWLRLVDQHGVTTTFSAPTPIRRVLDLPAEVREKYDMSTMKHLIANAAPWPFELKRRYVEAFGEQSLYEVYGATELGVITVLRPEDQMRKPGSCGQPVPGVEVLLVDDDGRPITEPNAPGELFAKSDSIVVGYHKAPEKYAEALRDGYMSVGDVAYVDDEGYYYVCDRKSDLIISGGVNVYPAEIEAVLVAHPEIADAGVIGVPDREWGESVHAFIVVSGDPADDAISSFAREHLAGYKIPRGYTRLDEIPRSASGKILKRDLRDVHAGKAPSSSA